MSAAAQVDENIGVWVTRGVLELVSAAGTKRRSSLRTPVTGVEYCFCFRGPACVPFRPGVARRGKRPHLYPGVPTSYVLTAAVADHRVRPGPGNLIGEHTDYNDGLELPFAIAQGVRVSAGRSNQTRSSPAADEDQQAVFRSPEVHATDGGWTEFVRGALGELQRAGHRSGPRIEIAGDVPEGAGLSSSAAPEVALSLALLLAPSSRPAPRASDRSGETLFAGRERLGRRPHRPARSARLAARRPDHALRIDFRTLAVEPVSLGSAAGGSSSSPRASSIRSRRVGLQQRRAECEHTRERLGLESLRDARPTTSPASRSPLDKRLRHVIEENPRVEETVSALQRVI